MSFGDTFKALSDPTRREILSLLKQGSMTAGQIGRTSVKLAEAGSLQFPHPRLQIPETVQHASGYPGSCHFKNHDFLSRNTVFQAILAVRHQKCGIFQAFPWHYLAKGLNHIMGHIGNQSAYCMPGRPVCLKTDYPNLAAFINHPFLQYFLQARAPVIWLPHEAEGLEEFNSATRS